MPSNPDAPRLAADTPNWISRNMRIVVSNIVTATTAVVFTVLIMRGGEQPQQKQVEKIEDIRPPEKPITKANLLLRSIPKEIHGATVEVTETPDATMVVIQVDDIHGSGKIGEFPSFEMKMDRARKNVTPAVEYLTGHFRSTKIFMEGLTEENEELVRELIDEMKKMAQAREKAVAFQEGLRGAILLSEQKKDHEITDILRANLQRSEKLTGKADEELAPRVHQARYALGCVTDLVLSGRVDIARSETKEVNPVGMKIPGHLSKKQLRADPVWGKKLYEDRERVMVQHMAKGGDPVAKIIVLGRDHDLGREIEKWNVSNPDRKMSHARVTGAGTRSLSKEMEDERKDRP